MGVTINSKNKSIDLGYGGFDRLRKKIATLINNEIGEHYKNCDEGSQIFNDEKRKEFFEKYDTKTKKIDKKYHYKYNKILHFLYACDCGATMSIEVCKDIYEIIKEHDDNSKYGYIGRSNCATFNDFKEIIKDCIDTNTKMQWN